MGCFTKLSAQHRNNYNNALKTLDQIQQLYSVLDGKKLFRETYPFDEQHQATYLGVEDQKPKANPYSYLWPFSGSLSAYVAVFESTKDKKTLQHIDKVVITGLANYYDTRIPHAYASYVKDAPLSDRFYDDNIWLGIDFVDLYLLTKKQAYLQEAKKIWTFVESGMDDKLGGGIYWCEQRKESKNTCSNAPAVVYLVKLYEATKETKYLDEAKSLYNWTKKFLQDPDDYLYWDNINLEKKVDKAKYPYNTGQMIQAGALLYKMTNDIRYLQDAQTSAKAGFVHFFTKNQNNQQGSTYPVLKRSDNWFIAIMLRGYIELYHLDNNKEYIAVFQANLDHAWQHMRDTNGLFGKDWTAREEKVGKKWLLDQFALAEMYARMSKI